MSNISPSLEFDYASRPSASTIEPVRVGYKNSFIRIDEYGGPNMPKTKPTTVDEYIAAAPQEAQAMLREIRALLKEVAPKAKETLKWGSPVFEEGRILFSYSAYKSHLNFMPTGPAMEPFKEELAEFKTGQDTIQLPYDKPLPQELVRKIAAFRAKQVRENDARWMY